MKLNLLLALGLTMGVGFGCSKTKSGEKGKGAGAGAEPSSENYNPADQESADSNNPGNAGDPAGSGALTCRLALDCQQTLPELPAAKGFNGIYNSGLGKTFANHRARDIVALEGAPLLIHAKFAYGVIDADLKGENVDIYLAEGCEKGFQKIGSATTSQEGENETIDGIEDSGGRLFTDMASLGVKSLPVGRHRVLLVVTADNSTADMYIEILPKKAAIVLTDIDGTLTSSEMAAATEIIKIHPETHPGAADLMRAYYHRGYSIFYLTARPEWLMPATREWLNIRGFPPGFIHTTSKKAGAQGDAAAQYKSDELKELKDKTGIVPSFAFGNKPSDVKGFGAAGIDPKNSYYFNLGDDAGGGTDHGDYRALVAGAQAAPSFCP